MADEKLSMGELRNKAMSFDRADMRDLYVKKDSEEYLCKRHMGVWNIDQARLACIAPKSYAVIQHKYAVEALIDAITSLNIKASAELKTEKHSVLVDFDFPESKFELKEFGESFTSGIRVVSDYSNSAAGLVIAARITRLACSNGMLISEVVKSQRIRFTEELNITIEGVIDKIIKDIITNDEKLANVVSICMRDSIEWITLKLLLRYMFKTKKHIKEIRARLPQDKEKPTRWDFFNAITHYASHGERLKHHVEAWLQNKAQKIMKTSFNELCEIELPPIEGEQTS